MIEEEVSDVKTNGYIIILLNVIQRMHCEKLWVVVHGIRQDNSRHDESHCLELSQRASLALNQLRYVTYRMTLNLNH